ncbi:MAG: DUF4175 family protein, partial [Rhodobacteraceae bacterium]|nr:DUF4175 family protein [Paracoccaceae bacterium]
LIAIDAAGQTGTAARAAVTLPGRRFFDPLAAALIEMRRDLLWTTANGARVAQVLRAVSNLPEGFFRDEGAYLQLRVAIRRLEAGLPGGLAPEVRDEVAEALWEIAALVEAGDLASALERLRRAQDRLSEAIRNGADPAEIAELMAELREAMDEYIRQLAENAEPGDAQQQAEAGQSRELTQDQLQQMLQQLQELMEQGRMAEAEALLEQLRQMMENLQVTQGGPGQQGDGQQAMRDLSDALRQQQGLSDDTFRDLQQRFGGGRPGPDGVPMPGMPGQQPGNRGTQSPEGTQPGGEGQAEGDRGEGTGTAEALADRQRALRELLREQQDRGLPYAGTEAGEGAAESLDEAGRAMDLAEKALREEDFGGALDAQSEALEALRDSLRDLGEALAQDGQTGNGNPGDAFGDADPGDATDPLGRNAGQFGRLGSDDNLLQGEDVYRRAQDLLDEIRRRTGEQTRPEAERDYLRRLLDRF